MMNLVSTVEGVPIDGGLFTGMGEALFRSKLKWEPPAQLRRLDKDPQKEKGNS